MFRGLVVGCPVMWQPPWRQPVALGAIDTTALASQWTDEFVARMRASKVFEQYFTVARQMRSEEKASRAVIPQLNVFARAATGILGLPYLVTVAPASSRPGSSYVHLNARAYMPPTPGAMPVVEMQLPPLPSNPPSEFYDTIRRASLEQLPHELLHVYQMLQERASTGTTADPRSASMDARTKRYRREYLSDPREMPAYAIDIARDLRDAGIDRLGFPASAEARRASWSLNRLYSTFDARVPADARILKNYTIKIARNLR